MKVILPALIITVIVGVPLLLLIGVATQLRKLARTLAHLISWLVKAAACSLIAGLLAAVLAQHAEWEAFAAGVLVGLLSLPITFFFTRPMQYGDEAKSAAPFDQRAETVHHAKPNAARAPIFKAPPRFSFRRRTDQESAEAGLNNAWAVAESLADWAPSRLAAVRTSCAALLREAELSPVNLEVKELVVLILRRIPDLIDACAKECRDSTPSERESLVEELLDALEGVGAKADRLRKHSRRSRGTPFDILRAHVGNRIKKEGWL